MAKPRIADLDIRAAIEGPFVALRVPIAQAVVLDALARKVGAFSVRYQHNYVCISTSGDVEGLNQWLVIQQGRDDMPENFVIVGTEVENVVEALMLCHEDLTKQGRTIDTGEREPLKTFDEVVAGPEQEIPSL